MTRDRANEVNLARPSDPDGRDHGRGLVGGLTCGLLLGDERSLRQVDKVAGPQWSPQVEPLESEDTASALVFASAGEDRLVPG